MYIISMHVHVHALSTCMPPQVSSLKKGCNPFTVWGTVAEHTALLFGNSATFGRGKKLNHLSVDLRINSGSGLAPGSLGWKLKINGDGSDKPDEVYYKD